MSSPRRRLSLALAFAVAALILLVSLLPRPPMELGGPRWSDKLGHLLAYALLGGLLCLSLPERPAAPRLLLAALAGVAFGGAIELLQPLTGRSRELLDLLADALGSGGGAAAAHALFRSRSAAG